MGQNPDWAQFLKNSVWLLHQIGDKAPSAARDRSEVVRALNRRCYPHAGNGVHSWCLSSSSPLLEGCSSFPVRATRRWPSSQAMNGYTTGRYSRPKLVLSNVRFDADVFTAATPIHRSLRAIVSNIFKRASCWFANYITVPRHHMTWTVKVFFLFYPCTTLINIQMKQRETAHSSKFLLVAPSYLLQSYNMLIIIIIPKG